MRFPVKVILSSLFFLLAAFFDGHATAGCIGRVTGAEFFCGDAITESCDLDEDLITTESSCFSIGANNITVDGQGRSITGPYVMDGAAGVGGKGVDLMVHDHVTIRNLVVNGFYWGINLYYGTSCAIQENTINGAYFGIELRTTSTSNLVQSNTVTGAVIGIKVIDSTNNTLSANIVSGGSQGIYLTTDADANLIEKNQVTSNLFDGIRAVEAERNTLVNNIVTSNGWDGIYVYRSPGTTIRHNQSLNNTYYGINVEDCSGNTLQYNKVTGNHDAGIHLASDAPDNILTGNKVCDNTGSPSSFDIHDEGGNRGSANTCGTSSGYNDSDAAAGCAFACGCGCVAGTTTYDCGDTIGSSCALNCDLVSFGSCFSVNADGITVDGNGFSIHGGGSGTGITAVGTEKTTIRNFNLDNFTTGVSLMPRRTPAKASTGNKLLGNRVDKSDLYGIYLMNSVKNTIDGNTVRDGANGISLQNQSTGNSLSGNIVARSTVDGFYFASAADNNTLTGNTSCASGNLDVNNLGTNSGTGTVCSHTGGTYNDTGKTGCAYACGLCSDGTFYGECSTVKPKFCMEGALIDNCLRCGCDSGNCNPATGACETTPPPSGACVGATREFSCGDSVTESCTLNGHMVSTGTCFTITADNVTIDGAGYTITGDKTGMAVATMVQDNIVVRNLNVKNFSTGMSLYYSNGSLIENCGVTDNEGSGIWVRTKTKNTTVRGNTVRLNDAVGIRVDDVTGNTIDGNTITENGRGIYVINNSTGNALVNNTVNDNRFGGMVFIGVANNSASANYFARNGVNALALHQSSGNTIQANNIRHQPETGILVFESNDNLITGNFLTDNAYDGIYLSSSTGNKLTGNTFCDNGDGTVYFDIDSTGGTSGGNNMCRNTKNYSDTGASGGCALACVVTGCDTGTVLYRCGDTVTQSCTLNGTLTSRGTCLTVGADNITIDGGGFALVGNNLFDTYGIHALNRDTVTIKNIEIYDYYGGVYFESVTGGSVTGSKIHTNKNGAMLAFSSNNQIKNNLFESNEYAAILLGYNSSDNVVSGNTADGNGSGIKLMYNSDQNDLASNKIYNSTGNGIYLDFDTNLNELTSNIICGNVIDIYQDGSNTGINNQCKSTYKWNDNGTTGCTSECSDRRDAYPWLKLLLLN